MIKIDQCISTALNNKLFSEVEVLYSKKNKILFHKAYREGGSQILGRVYDLASLTKPIATASSILLLEEKKELALSDRLQTFFPELASDPKKNLTIEQLLTHRSGLPAWKDLYSPAFQMDEALQKLFSVPLAYETDRKLVYSCLGYLFLGELIRRITGDTLTQFTKENVFLPSGMEQTCFNPIDAKNIVPTAHCRLRKKRLQGIVHDENAYAFRGEGGNAGLFSTALDLYKFSQVLLSGGCSTNTRIFTEKSVNRMLLNQVSEFNLPQRTFGWDINPERAEYRSCGKFFPVGAIGHLGFTGTSMWVSPQEESTIIILSNRVFYHREKTLKSMSVFRPELHNLLLSL